MILNKVLNKVFGVKARYKDQMVFGKGSKFLNNFSIRGAGNEKVLIGENCLLAVNIVKKVSTPQVTLV